jgi:hypothetical protein
MHGRQAAGEMYASSDIQRGPYLFNKKNIITHKQTVKLNSDYTVEFVSINTSKLDLTWIYLDKVISGFTVDRV